MATKKRIKTTARRSVQRVATMRGYRQAERIDRMVARLMEKHPMTTETAPEYLRLGRSLGTTGLALQQQAAEVMGYRELAVDAEPSAVRGRRAALAEKSAIEKEGEDE